MVTWKFNEFKKPLKMSLYVTVTEKLFGEFLFVRMLHVDCVGVFLRM